MSLDESETGMGEAGGRETAGARRGAADLSAPEEIAPGVAFLRHVLVNLYFLGDADAGDRGWVLVDSGLYGSAPTIRKAAAARFGEGARPAAIVLTHGHFDHVGGLAHLASEWECPIHAHPLELPYLTGRAKYPPMDPTVGGGGMALLSPLYPRGPEQLQGHVTALPEDGSVPGAEGWRWIHTPGHTPGHVSLFRESDRTVIAGDAVVTTRQESTLAVLMQRPEVSSPPAYATTDWQQAGASVEAISALGPELLATGHGVPLRGPSMRAALAVLARDFAAQGIPAQGRYVYEPALFDAQGVVHVPPAVPRDTMKLALGVAAVVVAGVAIATLLGRRRDREAEEEEFVRLAMLDELRSRTARPNDAYLDESIEGQAWQYQ